MIWHIEKMYIYFLENPFVNDNYTPSEQALEPDGSEDPDEDQVYKHKHHELVNRVSWNSHEKFTLFFLELFYFIINSNKSFFIHFKVVDY